VAIDGHLSSFLSTQRLQIRRNVVYDRDLALNIIEC
jgi:hypothetical protein